MTHSTPVEQAGNGRPQPQDSLIRLCGLSDHDVTRIHDLQRMLGLAFGHAAMCLGLASPEDVKAAETRDRVDQGAGLPLPCPDGSLSIAHDPYARRSEDICALRTELLLRRAPDGEANTLAVLGSRREEGRSQVAAELAISLSQLGLATLLVDADLRHPRQHALFGARPDFGLSEAIGHNRPVRPYSVCGLPHLSLLTAGESQRSAQELLSHDRLGALMNEWRRQYQYIIVDTPAAVVCPDAFAVARVTGRVLLVSRAEYTPYRDVRELLRRLSVAQARVLGSVVNRF